MIIFNHPVFPSNFGAFSSFSALQNTLSDCRSALAKSAKKGHSARIRQFIKPNKTEAKKPPGALRVIGESASDTQELLSSICRESCTGATSKTAQRAGQ